MPWPTTAHDLFEYVSSQTTLDAIMNADKKSLCPEEPRAAGKRVLRRWRSARAVKVTDGCNLVLCSAYAMKFASAGG